MNKNNYLVLALLVVALGAVTFFTLNKNNQTAPSPTAEVPTHATIATLSVTDDTSTALAISAGSKIVTWKTDGYPSGAGVNINLIRKISDSPKEFVLVRALATNAPNNGEYIWTPKAGENTNDLYTEVTCSSTYKFVQGCSLSTDPAKVTQ